VQIIISLSLIISSYVAARVGHAAQTSTYRESQQGSLLSRYLRLLRFLLFAQEIYFKKYYLHRKLLFTQVSGPVERSVLVESTHARREDNMWGFTKVQSRFRLRF
jgi:hypothetical protein